MKKINYALLSTLFTMLLVGCNTAGNSTKNTTSSSSSSSTVVNSTTSSSSSSVISSTSTSTTIGNSTTSTIPTTPVVVTYSLEVSNPTKVDYQYGDSLDTTGLTVSLVTLTNGIETDRVVLNTNEYTLTIEGNVVDNNFVLTTLGDVTLVVTYVEDTTLTANINLTVSTVITKRLEVDATNAKKEYESGETFDATGLKVDLCLNVNGTDTTTTSIEQYILTINGVDATGYVFDVEETTTLTVEVSIADESVATTSYEIVVNKKEEPAFDESNYIGEFKLFELSTKETATLVVKDDGTMIFGSYTLTYTVSESGNISINSLYGTSYAFDFSNGVALFTKGSGSSATKYVGMLGDNVTLNTLLLDGSYEALFEIQNDAVTKKAVVNYSDIIVEGKDIVFTLNGDSFNNSKSLIVRCLNDSENDGPLSLSYGYSAVERVIIEGTSYQFAYYSMDIANSTFTKVDVGEEKGTFTGEDGDLVLDGLFGEASLNGVKTTYTYNKNTDIVTVMVNGEEVSYKLDLTNKTYILNVIITSDPWSVATTYVASNKFELTFENGSVKIKALDGEEWITSTASYTISEGTVTFTFGWYDSYEWEEVDVTFTFIISGDLSSISLTKTVYLGSSWGATSYS